MIIYPPCSIHLSIKRLKIFIIVHSSHTISIGDSLSLLNIWLKKVFMNLTELGCVTIGTD